MAERGVGLALIAVLLGVFVQSLFYPGFLEDPLTWLALGVGAGYLTWPRRDDGTGRGEVVVDDPAAAMLVFEPGDVIVTTATSPSWNTLLVEAGALVTTNGGLTSHAAVTARDIENSRKMVSSVIGRLRAMSRLP